MTKPTMSVLRLFCCLCISQLSQHAGTFALQSPNVPSVEELLDHAVHMRAIDRKADQRNRTKGYRPITTQITKVSKATEMMHA